MKELERTIKALANKRRLSILRHLKKMRQATVTELAEAIDLSFRSTSRHLAVLSAANVLDKQQRSAEVYYWIAIKKHSVLEHVLSLL